MKNKEVIKFGGFEVHFCLEASDTKGQLTMFKCVINAGAKIPVPHYHENFDETVYGLKGIATYTVDGKQLRSVPEIHCSFRAVPCTALRTKQMRTLNSYAWQAPEFSVPIILKMWPM